MTALLFVVGLATVVIFHDQFKELTKQTGILNTQAQQAAANDTFHTYQWDANGHATAVDNINVIYDALGRAVEGDWPDGGKSEKVYDETGLTAVMLGTSMGVARIPLPGGAWARYTPSGLSDYWHPDGLGTSRLESTPGRTVDVDAAFAPFGEVYTHADNFDLTFTGNTNTDTVIDMYDFPYRRYHPVQGRWISPDPVPGTGNKYVYADNNPLSKVDPYGLATLSVEMNGLEIGTTTGDESDDNQLVITESHPPTSVQTPAQATVDHSEDDQHGSIWRWFHNHGFFQTDAEITESRRQWLINHATNDADKDKIRHAPADKVNNTFECLQSPSCTAKFQAYVQALAQAAAMVRFGNNPNQDYHTFRHVEEAGINRSAQRICRTAEWEAFDSLALSREPWEKP